MRKGNHDRRVETCATFFGNESEVIRDLLLFAAAGQEMTRNQSSTAAIEQTMEGPHGF
jgi:hypothetical protein